MAEQLIDIQHVTRTFSVGNRSVQALRGITLALPPGSFTVFMGPSGSGKTTLLNMIGALDRPTSGEVRLDGQVISRMPAGSLARLRRSIGYIFQSFALMPTASAYENVELALRISGNVPRSQWDARIRRCLAAVGLGGWMDHRPYELSGGQQQRVAIARALAIRPRLILADEPTGDLDSKTGRQVLALLRALVDHEGVTLVMSTHDPVAAEFATRVYQLRDGVVVE